MNERGLSMEQNEKIINFYQAVNLVRGIYKSVERDWSEGARKNGLTYTQQNVLWTVHLEEGLTVSQLAQRTILQLPTLTELLNRMDKKGLVHLEKDKNDARVTRVSSTELGEELRKQASSTIDQYPKMKAILEKVDSGELPNLIEELYQFAEIIMDNEFPTYVKESTEKFRQAK